jgi:hypothetical protein
VISVEILADAIISSECRDHQQLCQIYDFMLRHGVSPDMAREELMRYLEGRPSDLLMRMCSDHVAADEAVSRNQSCR